MPDPLCFKCSVSDIDAFRYWLESEYDPDGAELIKQLRKELPKTEAMERGIAFHSALEKARQGEFDYLQADGYTFFVKEGMEIQLSQFREMQFPSIRYTVNGIHCFVSGRIDSLHCGVIDDHKTTEEFKIEKYLDSYQWRFYLDMTHCNVFRWNVFVLYQLNKKDIPRVVDCNPNKAYSVAALHQFKQFRYPSLREDCETMLKRFLEFCHQYLPERFSTLPFVQKAS